MSTRTNWLVTAFKFNLKFFMGLRDINQSDLAKTLKVSRTQINKLLGPESNPTIETIMLLARALSVPPDLLLKVPREDWFDVYEEGSMALYDTLEELEKALVTYHDAKGMLAFDKREVELEAAKTKKKKVKSKARK